MKSRGSKRRHSVRIAAQGYKTSVGIHDIKGVRPGPTLALVSGQHGGEWNGIEILRRVAVLTKSSALSGRLIVVPCANPEATKLMNEGFPVDWDIEALRETPGDPHSLLRYPWAACKNVNRENDPYNMNRKWPGKADGTLVQQTAYAIWEKAVAPADYVVDYHCYSDFWPHCAYLHRKSVVPLAAAFGIGLIWHLRKGEDDPAGMLHVAAERAGKTAFTVEFTPQRRLDYAEVAFGVEATLRLMVYLNMIEKPATLPVAPDPQYVVNWQQETAYIKSDATGLAVMSVPLMSELDKGEEIGRLVDLNLGASSHIFRSPMKGLLIRRPGPHYDIVHRGDTVFQVIDAKRISAPQRPQPTSRRSP